MSDLLTEFSRIGHSTKILVFGDLMLDRYTWGDAERVSPEAPVIVLRADQEEIRPGGAASVAYLLRHLEAEVTVAGVVGNDSDGHTLRALLRDEGIDDQFVLTDPSRPTTAKHRFVGRASDKHPHQILRVDHESRVAISESLSADLWESLKSRLAEFDAILVADYLKGVCTVRLLQQIITTARAHGEPVLIDPGKTTDYERYRGASLLKPNRSEAELVYGHALDSTEQALQAADTLRATWGLDAAIITLDRDGLVLSARGNREILPSEPRTVYDITGAGDMVLATLGLCVAGGVRLLDAARIANVGAGLQVERFGIAPVTRSEIVGKLSPKTNRSASKLATLEEITALSDEYRRQGKRIVFTNGCFDLLHVGHATYLQEAATLGDILIVAVNSDASVRRLKGPTRPIIADCDRATLLAALECVCHVVIYKEDTPHRLLECIHPNILIKGGTTTDIAGREIVEAYGGKVCRAGEFPGISTTAILSHVQSVGSPL